MRIIDERKALKHVSVDYKKAYSTYKSNTPDGGFNPMRMIISEYGRFVITVIMGVFALWLATWLPGMFKDFSTLYIQTNLEFCLIM